MRSFDEDEDEGVSIAPCRLVAFNFLSLLPVRISVE